MRKRKTRRIVLIATGGTIASKENPETGLLTAGAMTGEELSEKCELPNDIEIIVKSIFQIPSNQMTFTKLMKLKIEIEETFADEKVDGLVVTHGTDTLEETAYFLDLIIADDRPVVVTGSQRGPTVTGSDAFVNLRQAILVAAHPAARMIGSFVLFNEKIYSARHVTKYHASNVAGFTAYGYGYLGIIDGDDLYFYQKPVHRETYELTSALPPVEIVKSYLGSDGKVIRFLIEQGAKGIIVEAAGRGHVHPDFMQHVHAAIAANIPVVLTTSATEGEVKIVYDFPGSVDDLHKAGVILGKDYSSKKARIKLAVLLASKEKKLAEKFKQ